MDSSGGDNDKAAPVASAEQPPRTINVRILSPILDATSGIEIHGLPVDTTLAVLRQKICDAIPSHPPSDRQRLIFQGRLLADDNDTLHTVFGSAAVSLNVAMDTPATWTNHPADPPTQRFHPPSGCETARNATSVPHNYPASATTPCSSTSSAARSTPAKPASTPPPATSSLQATQHATAAWLHDGPDSGHASYSPLHTQPSSSPPPS